MNKKYIMAIFFFAFTKSTSFAMSAELQPRVHYDEVAYDRLKAFGHGEGIDNNLFENENLKGIKLEEFDLKNVFFDSSKMNHSRFIGLSLEDDSKIVNSNLKKACFKDSFFYDSGIFSSKFIDLKIWSSVFNNFVMFGSDFSKSTFLNCRFANMIKETNKGKKCYISKNNFSDSQFKYCTFQGVGLRNNNFTRATLDKTSLKKCFIIGADFSGAIFNDVIFEKCIFVDCKDLDKVSFNGCVLFNRCEFIKTDGDKKIADSSIRKIRRFGRYISKESGKWEVFKKVAGAHIGIEGLCDRLILPSNPTSEYEQNILSECRKLSSMYLDQGLQPVTCSTSNL